MSQNISIPTKPFPEYKWRWAEYTPSEGLNHPLRFLGVLRVLYENQGERPSSDAVYQGLQKVQDDINETLSGNNITLAKSRDRNLIRRHGRYWKALGVLDPDSSIIRITEFGEKIANGDITRTEFALTVVNTLKLPNERIESQSTIEKWKEASLEIRPLKLILQILSNLFDQFGGEQAFLTQNELIKVIIPLAGIKSDLPTYIDSIQKFRRNELNVNQWPDCTPGANDHRMAREFLLFLESYNFCTCIHQAKRNANEKFFVSDYYLSEATDVLSLEEQVNLENLLSTIREKSIFFEGERKRILSEIVSRPNQGKFRKEVINSYNSQCVLTNVDVDKVLQACHIVPIKYNGSDTISNSLCLRADLHILFDSGNIRINPEGSIKLSEELVSRTGYNGLPDSISVPDFVSREALQWRWNYY